MNITDYLSSNNRLMGLSGLDIEGMMKSVAKTARKPVDLLYQRRQLLEWRQAQYREVTARITSFKNAQFDVLRGDQSILSPAFFKKYQTTVSHPDLVGVSYGVSAKNVSHTISIDRLATYATMTGGEVSAEVQASGEADWTAAHGRVFYMEIDSVLRLVTVGEDIVDAATLQDELDRIFGTDMVTVTDDLGRIGFETDGITSSKVTLRRVSSSGNDALTALGYGPNDNLSNRIQAEYTLTKLNEVGDLHNPVTFDALGQVRFKVNGTEFAFRSSDSLARIMETVSASEAGVTMRYDEQADKVVFTAKVGGAGRTISLEETGLAGGDFLSALGFDTGAATQFDPPQYEAGEYARVTVDGRLYSLESNDFDIDGVSYSLKGASVGTVIKVSAKVDTEHALAGVKAFIAAYNDMLDMVNGKYKQRYEYNKYPPLTEDQKEKLRDSEIDAYESKAKVGLLYNDPILVEFVRDIRRAVSDPVSGVTGLLASIGITSMDYSEGGRLYLNESRFLSEMERDADNVAELFTKRSSIDINALNRTAHGFNELVDFRMKILQYRGVAITPDTVIDTSSPLSSSERGILRTIWRQESGIAQRMLDVINDNVSTIRYKGVDQKGKLIMKAGVESDTSGTSNSMNKELTEFERRIQIAERRYQKIIDDYLNKLTALETAMARMNQQTAWVMQQFADIN
ncbi:MAG: flagellar filament capping protein FliD [Oscillospiraceae bacterium]|nr:flagellar filament capping protein FliD [Oscillospiraceae bacterium]